MPEQKSKPVRGRKATAQKLRHVAVVMRLLGMHKMSTSSDYDSPLTFDTIQFFDNEDKPVVGMEAELETTALELLKKFGIPELENKNDRLENNGCEISFEFNDDYILEGEISYYVDNETDDGYEGSLLDMLGESKEEDYNELLNLFKEHGIKEISGEFSGGNDSGGFDTFYYLDASGQELSISNEIQNNIQGMIENQIFDRLEVYGFNGDFSVGGSMKIFYNAEVGEYLVEATKSESYEESTSDFFALPNY